MYRKLTVLALVAIIASVSLTGIIHGGEPQPKLNQTTQQLLQGLDTNSPLRMELLPESSGKSYRQVIKTADGLVIKTVWTEASGGAVDHVYVTGKQVTRFTRSTSDGRLRYEAVYENGAHITKAERRRADGTVEETYARNENGGVWTTFAADGKTAVKQVVKDKGVWTVKDLTATAPEAKPLAREEFKMGTFKLEGSDADQPVLHFWTLHGKINEWWWNRADGQVRQHGIVLPSGELKVEYYNGKAIQSTQVFRPVFEDWGRSFYRLKQVTVYFANNQEGKVDKIFNLYDDGVTVRSWEDFAMTGTRNWTRHFDRKGLPIRQDNFKYTNGDLKTETMESKDLSGDANRTPQILPAQYGPAIGNDTTGGERVRTEPNPFDLKLNPDVRGIVEQFFVDPGRAMAPPPTPEYHGMEE